MKKLKFLAVMMLVFLGIGVSGTVAGAMLLEYDGGVYQYNGAVYDLVVMNKKIEPALEPIIFNDRALVPVRDVFEEVGATVNYYGDTQTVEVIDDGTYVRMNINDNIAYVNGEKTVIPDSVVPKLISKVGGETKTMVPVRFISETIGLDVDFDGDEGVILVESDENYNATPQPVVTPAPTAAPTAVPTAAPAPTPEQLRILDVSYENVETGKIAVTLKMNGKAEYSYFTLTDPNRLVVDVMNAACDVGDLTLYVNNGGIEAVRVGVHPDSTRIVIDMDNIANYGFGSDGNDIIIYARATGGGTDSGSDSIIVKPTATPVPTQKPSANVVYNKNLVVLDAGHGGYDPGAQGTLNGQTINESDITLQITYKIKEILESSGYSVLMTRTDDTYKTLIERPELANENNAALFVSVHINSVDGAPTANGTEVYYAESNNGDVGGVTSSMLAKNVLESMIGSTGSTNRGVKTAEHAVTKRSNMPACLAEVGFITNADELAKMTSEDYQYKTAQGIANGIIKTLQQMK